MTSVTVEVLVDPDDDLATAEQLRKHFEGDGARTVAVPPFDLGSVELVWLILRALGKETGTVRKLHDVGWPEATTWLRAHGVHTLLVLCAQHLREDRRAELCHNTTAAGVSLILVYGGAGQQPSTRTLAELLGRQPAPATAPPDRAPWPEVPRSHPLRFRYDCEQQLELADFLVVEDLLRDVHDCLFNHMLVRRTPAEIAAAVAVLSHAEDPNQRHIRRCGVQLALISSGTSSPKHPLITTTATRSATGVEAALRQAHPQAAAFVLAEALTGLGHGLLRLVRGDQLQSGRVLGIQIPCEAAAIQHALPVNASLRPPHDHIDPSRTSRPSISQTQHPPPEIVEVLERLLRARHQREPADELMPETINELDNLVALGVIELTDGIYRISRLGAYGSYLQNAGPPSAFKHHAQLVASHDH